MTITTMVIRTMLVKQSKIYNHRKTNRSSTGRIDSFQFTKVSLIAVVRIAVSVTSSQSGRTRTGITVGSWREALKRGKLA